MLYALKCTIYSLLLVLTSLSALVNSTAQTNLIRYEYISICFLSVATLLNMFLYSDIANKLYIIFTSNNVRFSNLALVSNCLKRERPTFCTHYLQICAFLSSNLNTENWKSNNDKCFKIK